jgi:hypothetical protein
MAEASELARTQAIPSGALHDLARIAALSAAAAREDPALPKAERERLGERYAARAVELLRQARAAGSRRLAEVQADRDFQPLHRRADFKELVREAGGR